MDRHTKFKADAGFSHADPGNTTHEHLCKLLQRAVAVDQYDAANAITMELICRETQMIDEKYTGRVRTKDAISEESEYFLRTSTGSLNVCVHVRPCGPRSEKNYEPTQRC